MFSELAARLTASSKLLHELFTDPSRMDELVAQIKDLEHQADNLTHEVNAKIDSSFVTPLDREDIHILTTRLDNVIDLVDGAARRAKMFDIRDANPAAITLAQYIHEACTHIATAVEDARKPKIVTVEAREIKRLEECGDQLYFEAVGALFRGGADALHVMKWKDVYDTLEDALDECEDVANALESIAIKNS